MAGSLHPFICHAYKYAYTLCLLLACIALRSLASGHQQSLDFSLFLADFIALAGTCSRLSGLTGGTRTPDLLLRRQLLYPVELRSDRFLLYRAVLIQQQLWLLLSVKKGLTNNKPVNP